MDCLRKSTAIFSTTEMYGNGWKDILLVVGWTWLLALSVSRVKAPYSCLVWGVLGLGGFSWCRTVNFVLNLGRKITT